MDVSQPLSVAQATRFLFEKAKPRALNSRTGPGGLVNGWFSNVFKLFAWLLMGFSLSLHRFKLVFT